MIKNTQQQNCFTNLNILNNFAKSSNEYNIFKDNKGNDIILYYNDGEILICSCSKINEIDFNSNNNEECLKEIPVKIYKGNRNFTVYLTYNMILKTDKSKRLNCDKPIYAKITMDKYLIYSNDKKISKTLNRQKLEINYILPNALVNFEHPEEQNIEYTRRLKLN